MPFLLLMRQGNYHRSKTYCPIGLEVNRIRKNKYLQHFGVCSSSCFFKQAKYGFAFRVRNKNKGEYEKRMRECIENCTIQDPNPRFNILENGLYCPVKTDKNHSKWLGHCICEGDGCYPGQLF